MSKQQNLSSAADVSVAMLKRNGKVALKQLAAEQFALGEKRVST